MSSPLVSPYPLSLDKTDFMAIHLAGTLNIAPQNVGGYTIGGLSGLAWDEDERILYAVSDVGILFHLQPIFKQAQLTDIKLLGAYPLTDAWGKTLAQAQNKSLSDAEGLVARHADNGIQGDTELLVSFERTPRINRYRPDGSWLGQVPLPKALQDKQVYRDKNKMLEALAWHPRWGIVSSPEFPLKAEADDALVIYADQKIWRTHLSPEKNSGVVALEVLHDGTMVIMERAFTMPLLPFYITLRQFFPDTGEIMTLARFDSSRGWRLDNFEGLTAYGDKGLLVVSDNNFNGMQRTLLSYFELR